MNIETQYLNLISDVLQHGVVKEDRTGTGTRSVFGRQLRHDLSKGFPLMTHKKMVLHSVLAELYWFLEGSTDERRLAEITYGKPRSELVGKNTIWTANADHQGIALGYINDDSRKLLGPVYGSQWRNWDGVDQIEELIYGLKNNPDGRRHIVSAWNVGELGHMALPPCHVMSQFYVSNGKLSCMFTQRSVDIMLGAPYNIASYAAMTHIIAREVGLGVGDLIYNMGDAHIYSNHIEGAKEALGRETFSLPTLKIDPDFDLTAILDGVTPLNIKGKVVVEDYHHGDTIKMPMAV